MKRHLLCLTVDTDPDGLSGKVTNRQSLQWEGLERLQSLPEELAASHELGRVPITWFVRADGQLESIFGTLAYLLEKYGAFWKSVKAAGDELGWHPHLYRQARTENPAVLITDPSEAAQELQRLWSGLRPNFLATAFRNGEGWHTRQTYSMVERLGFCCDSTAIPGRKGDAGHPTNWEGSPNQPYFPALDDIRRSGSERSLLELPMNTWRLQAPYDRSPKLRYMNPAVHPHLFAKALKNWENECTLFPAKLLIWVMIFHPDEVLAAQGEDRLYSRSTRSMCANLVSFTQTIRRLGHEFEWVTLSNAAARWREYRRLSA